jgi:hypothetical protein
MTGAMLRDNPVLVKHLRARLRLHRAIPWVAIVVILSALITYRAHTSNAPPEEAFYMMLALQVFLLQLAGTAQVMTSVSRARESGMLEFHRISPQRPASVALGFMLGAPVLEYALFACTVPFSLAVAVGYIGFSNWLVIFADILIAAVLYHAAAVLAGLVLPKTTSSPVLLVGLVFLLLPFWGLLTFLRPLTYFTLIPTVTAATSSAALAGTTEIAIFLEKTLPAFLISLLHQIPVLMVFFFAASRKMQHESAYPLSKLGAVLAYALIALLAVADASVSLDSHRQGPFPGASPEFSLPILCYTLFLLGMLLSAAVTPDASAFARGIRQARRLGLSRPSRWSDRAPNWVAIGGFWAILLLAGAAATRMVSTPDRWIEKGLWATATAACALAFFGFAKQSFDLWFRKKSSVFLILLLFLVWGVPVLFGLLLTNPNVVMSLSPLAGIAVTLSVYPGGDVSNAAVTALAASAFLAVCFAGLCWAAVRRAAKTAQARS